jgi:uncharacterized protein YkwD
MAKTFLLLFTALSLPLSSMAETIGHSRAESLPARSAGAKNQKNKNSDDSFCPGLSDIARVCRLVNIERRKRNLAPVKLDSSLSQMAHEWSSQLNRNDARKNISHANFEVRRQSCGSLAENVSWRGVPGRSTPENVMRGWMNSSGHRANILTRSFRRIGVGHSGGYWTQEFR